MTRRSDPFVARMSGAICGSLTSVLRRPPDIAPLIRATCRPGEVVAGARYATNFLYSQRRPSWRRQTCPRTSRPVMLHLGMMTRRKCQVVGLAGRFNPNVRILMVAILIDAMLPHLARAARCRPPPAAGVSAPLIGSRDRRLCRDREKKH